MFEQSGARGIRRSNGEYAYVGRPARGLVSSADYCQGHDLSLCARLLFLIRLHPYLPGWLTLTTHDGRRAMSVSRERLVLIEGKKNWEIKECQSFSSDSSEIRDSAEQAMRSVPNPKWKLSTRGVKCLANECHPSRMAQLLQRYARTERDVSLTRTASELSLSRRGEKTRDGNTIAVLFELSTRRPIGSSRYLGRRRDARLVLRRVEFIR